MKPKLQLSPGDYVTEAFRAEINAWMIDFFGYEDELETNPHPVVLNDSNLTIKKRREPRKTNNKTLGELLKNIDATFKELEFDIDDVTFYSMLKTDVIGLKKCSPLITLTTFHDTPQAFDTVDLSKGLPTYFVIAVNKGEASNQDYLSPDFCFGMKVKKVPWNVTRLTGTVYLYGMAWRDGKKHVWQGFWLSVLPDGSIKVADELKNKYVKVKDGYFTQRAWEKSSWSTTHKDREMVVRHCFCETLTRYQTRNDNWNIGVSNGKKRITFLIPDNEAKSYFKDRVKTKTGTGKTKPIIHFVQAHTQRHRDKTVDIPEHIRGVREFDWENYHCTITAPAFHKILSSDFEEAGEYVLDEDLSNKLISIGTLAEKMNSLEDAGYKRK